MREKRNNLSNISNNYNGQLKETMRTVNWYIIVHYIEAERQKWEACEARLAAQSDKAMKKIAELNDQSEARENTRLLSVSKESDETNEPVSSFVSPTVSHTHTNMIKEVSKSVILKGSDIETLADDSYSVSYPPVSMLNQLLLLYKYWLQWGRLKVNGVNGNI